MSHRTPPPSAHLAIQRVLVRMHYDPGLVAAVARDPDGALAGLGLPAAARRWLGEVDPRAFEVDPLRPHRALTALLGELKASAAAACRRGGPVAGGVAALGSFFRSPRFHRAIEDRRPLALAFADHLEDLARGERTGAEADAITLALVALERASCEARRGVARAAGDRAGALRLSGRARLVEGAAGGLDALRAYEGALAAAGRDPVAALIEGTVLAPRVEVDPAATELVLVEHTASGTTLEAVSDELFALLRAAEDGAEVTALAAWLVNEGLEPTEAHELLDELVASGILVGA